MTKEELFNIISKPINELNGFELHIKHMYENNNSKSLFSLTGIDFSEMFKGRKDTSGIKLKK